RIAEHEVVAGDVWEAPEIHAIAELRPARGETAVAAGPRYQRVPRQHPVSDRLGKAEDIHAGEPRLADDAVDEARPATAAPAGGPEPEPALCEAAGTVDGEVMTVADLQHLRLRPILRILEVDATTRIAEFGVAECLVEPPGRHVQRLLSRAQLGSEDAVLADDLADAGAPQQHALGGLSPVHPPRLDRGAIIAPEQDVVLGDGGRMQHADHLGGGHLRPQLLGCLAAVKPMRRHEFDAVETDRQVVVGET